MANRKISWIESEGEWKPAEGTVYANLRPGLYGIKEESMGLFGSSAALYDLKPNTDRLLQLEGSLTEYIACSVRKFWESRHTYEEMGLLHKRGLLLEGAPGSGKTATCLSVGGEIAKLGGAAFFFSPSNDLKWLPKVLEAARESQRDLPLLAIIEDMDRYTDPKKQRFSGQAETNIHLLLSLLDGEKQISNVVYLATTNFVKKLDFRLTNRPSRFDEVIATKPPAAKVREAYFRNVLPAQAAEDGGIIGGSTIDKLVGASKGLYFAHMKELAIAHYVYKHPLDEVTARIRELAENKSTGFSPDTEED